MKKASLLLIVVFAMPTTACGQKSVKVTVSLRGAIGDGSVKVFRSTLGKVSGIKFKADDIVKGQKPRFYSKPFAITIADIKKTDIGAIGKAAVNAKTPLRDELDPGLNLVLYSQDQITERLIVKARDALRNVKGVLAGERGGIGGSTQDDTMWVRIDGSGKAKLQTIVDTLKNAGVRVVVERSSP